MNANLFVKLRTRSTRLVLVLVPLAVLAAWAFRLVPQAVRAHAAVSHCTAWSDALLRHHDPLFEIQERCFAMHHGASYGVERAALDQALEAYRTSRARLAERTRGEQDPLLDRLDQDVRIYLVQVERVAEAVKAAEDARTPEDRKTASAGISETLAHLSHHFRTVSASYRALEDHHRDMLESSLRGLKRHADEVAAFAGLSMALAMAFAILGLVSYRERDRFKESAAFAHSLLDTVPAGVLLWDAGHKVRRSNAAAGRMLGFPEETVQDHDLKSLFPEHVAKQLIEAEEGRIITFNHQHPGGPFSVFEASVSAVCSSGDSFRLAVFQDISARVETERRLHENQRMAALGVQVSGAVRDLERLVHPLLLAVDMLRNSRPDRDQTEDLYYRLDREARAIIDLITQMTRSIRQDEEAARPSLFELHACVWEAVSSLEVGAGLQFDIQVPDGACLVRGHRPFVAATVLGLLQRGATLLGGGRGLLELNVQEEEEMALIEISDSADAIPDALIPQVFTATYLSSLNAAGPDLAAMAAGMREMGGELKVARDPAGRTVFTLVLPIVEE